MIEEPRGSPLGKYLHEPTESLVGKRITHENFGWDSYHITEATESYLCVSIGRHKHRMGWSDPLLREARIVD